MTEGPPNPLERHRQPVGDPQRRNLLAIVAATFAVFGLLVMISSLSYKPGDDIGTDYAAGRFGAPLPFAVIALACGVPALLRTRRPAGRDGRTWGGREPAVVSVVAACLATVVAVFRIALLVASR